MADFTNNMFNLSDSDYEKHTTSVKEIVKENQKRVEVLQRTKAKAKKSNNPAITF